MVNVKGDIFCVGKLQFNTINFEESFILFTTLHLQNLCYNGFLSSDFVRVIVCCWKWKKETSIYRRVMESLKKKNM